MGVSHSAYDVHWLPYYIDNATIGGALHSYGKVLSVQEEVSQLDGLPNGIKRVRLETKTSANLLQHMIHVSFLSKRYTGLVTVPGRPPLCLKCKVIGHVRGERNVVPVRAGTYAAAIAGQDR